MGYLTRNEIIDFFDSLSYETTLLSDNHVSWHTKWMVRMRWKRNEGEDFFRIVVLTKRAKSSQFRDYPIKFEPITHELLPLLRLVRGGIYLTQANLPGPFPYKMTSDEIVQQKHGAKNKIKMVRTTVLKSAEVLQLCGLNQNCRIMEDAILDAKIQPWYVVQCTTVTNNNIKIISTDTHWYPLDVHGRKVTTNVAIEHGWGNKKRDNVNLLAMGKLDFELISAAIQHFNKSI